MWNEESCEVVIFGKSSVESCENYTLSLFRIPQPKNSAFPQIAKTAVHSHCTTDVQPMYGSVWRPMIPSFRIL